MEIVLKSKIEKNYLFIDASGQITNQKEHEELTMLFYEEIKMQDFEKIIINVSKISYPPSLEIHKDIVEFYKSDMPAEIFGWKIAVVDESDYREIGYYWEYLTQQSGIPNFRVFGSLEEAKTFIVGEE
ncbi:MAG: hypothetical protein H6696_16945 [Deferribacteres bacterium]|nr:hypothetical protein [candidate division KSB1 bacterium]MCB9503622.1 hypothetical protein [Deferribacteres bacterium]